MLDSALDWGISEIDFWDMTVGEVLRAIKSKEKVRQLQLKERAYFDHRLATLLSIGVSKSLGSKQEFPDVEHAYPELFPKKELSEQEKEQEKQKQTQISVARFIQFAQSHNSKLKQGGGE